MTAASRGRRISRSILRYRILHLCVDKGGSITGEHGVGREKQQAMGYMFSEPDLATMQRVRIAFDPAGIANPDKIFPRTKLCGEKTGPYTPHPLEDGRRSGVFLAMSSLLTHITQRSPLLPARSTCAHMKNICTLRPRTRSRSQPYCSMRTRMGSR